ncbi:MAG TPA: ergothioneine biosynthesis protein EgtB [Rhodanobacteraceae bacterium]|jgi:ergothioneine biosynthesis protein EgtB|nr:ergothioneine biosynthesis protein EgtB [Rhodanobacteraceae bacterium]
MSAQPEPAGDRRAADAGSSYRQVRDATLALCATLAPEDTVAQSMPDASPAKWHLAHTTWFFEQFLLAPFDPGYRRFREGWDYLFNSYYQAVGPMHARPQRGLLTRPTLDQVTEYRANVDAAMVELLRRRDDDREVLARVTLGLNHEQQHQELLLTDILHLFSLNPLQPVYREAPPFAQRKSVPLQFIAGRHGIVEIGHAGKGFAYDNESPRHRALLHPHAIANRCTTNAEFREFIDDGGYRNPALWLSEGWDTVRREGWSHPLYWDDALETTFTLAGRQPIDPAAPVCHVSFFEADAFARWSDARLPTEFEWEAMVEDIPVEGNLVDSGALRPLPVQADHADPLQMFGDVWEWTSSPYIGYPGYKPAAGALGEYNGKFMCGQWVLRGGSCATPAGHVRASYRNFFHPAARWQFSGIRLARDA